MSGGGGDYGGVRPDKKIPCDQLVFQAILQSPEPTVVGQLKKDDILEVIAAGDTGPVNAVHSEHGIAGSIVSNISNLLDCLTNGFEYSASVLESQGGRVTVEVRPK